jgi:hypothetical protein
MTVTIEIPKSVEERLSQKAKDAGLDLATYVARVAEADARKPTLKELSGPVYEQFLASGMTDEELGEFLEKAKHEMRAERRAKASHGG